MGFEIGLCQSFDEKPGVRGVLEDPSLDVLSTGAVFKAALGLELFKNRIQVLLGIRELAVVHVYQSQRLVNLQHRLQVVLHIRGVAGVAFFQGHLGSLCVLKTSGTYKLRARDLSEDAAKGSLVVNLRRVRYDGDLH